MATTKALLFLARRSNLLPYAVQMTPMKSNFYLRLCTSKANYSDQKSMTKSDRNDSGGQVQVSFGETVKKNTKFAWYLSIIIAGFGVTYVMCYVILRELFSKKSPNGVYSMALDRVMEDQKIMDSLGSPIKAHGEETRRGRRGHVRHTLYEKNGVPHMRMTFYIQGLRKSGTVNLEVREDSSGDWVYRYLFVQLKDMNQTVIVLEDNRDMENNVYKAPNNLPELVPSEFKL